MYKVIEGLLGTQTHVNHSQIAAKRAKNAPVHTSRRSSIPSPLTMEIIDIVDVVSAVLQGSDGEVRLPRGGDDEGVKWWT